MSQKGWYYRAMVADFGGIFYSDGSPDEDSNYFGPFDTFGEAKRDAIRFFKADIDHARGQIEEIRSLKRKDCV